MASIMTGRIGPLQVLEARSFAGLTTENKLVNHYLTEPAKVDSVLSYWFGQSQSNILTLLTGGIGNTEGVEIGSNEYQWDLYTWNDRSIEIIKNYGDGGGTPGFMGTTFRLQLREGRFRNSDVLVTTKGTHIRVMEDPTPSGSGFDYTFQINNGNDKKFLLATEIAPGQRLSKDYSTVAEGSRKGGSIDYRTPFKLRNCLTTIRKDFEVTRSAAKSLITVDMFHPNDPKKTTRMWTTLAEWTAMSQFYTEQNKLFMYGEYNRTPTNTVQLLDGRSMPIIEGAGLRAQISPANRWYYSRLTYDYLFNFLLDLSYNAQEWGGNYKFLALTGKMGMIEFNRAMKEQATLLPVQLYDANKFIGGSGQELVLQGQFTGVKFTNGIELVVKEFPMYDDIERNRELDPVSGKPLESFRFTIIDIGQGGQGAGIKKMCRKDSDLIMWHSGGSIDPSGNTKKSLSTMGSSGFDGYEGYLLSECGIKLSNPLACGELIKVI